MPAESGHIEAIGLIVEYKPVQRALIEAIGMIVEYSENEYTGRIEAIGMIVEYKEFTLLGVDPAVIHDNGDVVVTLTGDFVAGRTYQITINDEPCYSGRLGEGYFPVCETTGSLTVISPPVAVGGPFDVAATDVTVSATSTLAASMTVVKASVTSVVLGLRSSTGLPRSVGPRTIKDEPLT